MTGITYKLHYLYLCVLASGQKKSCPYCGGKQFDLVQRKYLITTLLKCKHCKLQHRHPKDNDAFLEDFYQEDYEVDVEMMTDMPDSVTLAKLKEQNFPDLRDFSPIIKAALPGRKDIRMVDYGCSWGYNIFKLQQEGIAASGYELSRPRAAYGRNNLEVSIADKEQDIPTGNDVFFSSHVIEHLPHIDKFIEFCKSRLNPDGLFMAFCPNGSKEYRQRDEYTFTVTWGSLHPNYLDVEFAQHLFRNNPYLILTSDWPYNLEEIGSWDGKSQVVSPDRGGYELLIIAKPNILIPKTW